MSALAQWTLLLGSLKLLASGMIVLFPERSAAWLKQFPRNVWAGRILATIALAWGCIMVNEMPLGPADQYKPLLWVLGPVLVFLAIRFMDDLLAVRALGGLYLLLAAPVLDAARWHPSPWRLIVTVMVYAMIIFGMWIILAPFRFRHILEWWQKRAGGLRSSGWMGIGIALLLIMLALFVYA